MEEAHRGLVHPRPSGSTKMQLNAKYSHLEAIKKPIPINMSPEALGRCGVDIVEQRRSAEVNS